MRLSDFIRRNRTSIIDEWQAFARTLRPSAGLSELQLMDHVSQILAFIADDIETKQTAFEQFEKSQGRQDSKNPAVETAAQTHASLRHQEGFDIVEMVSEYRALRASVLKLWAGSQTVLSEQDVYDLGRFNEAIDQALAESVLRFNQSVDKAKDLLLGVLGHDIRSPVSAIQMAADLVPRAGPITQQQQSLLTQVKVSADRVQVIVRDLLDLARSRNGQSLPIVRKLCSLADISRTIVHEMRLRHTDREIDLAISGETGGYFDETRLGQLLSNLLANAVQYGRHDQPIRVELTGGKEEVLMTVSNGGDPIPPTHLELIFQSFSRVSSQEPPSDIPSSNLGLGLFIAREIALAHGGTISVVSDEAKTAFCVHLPKVPQQVDED